MRKVSPRTLPFVARVAVALFCAGLCACPSDSEKEGDGGASSDAQTGSPSGDGGKDASASADAQGSGTHDADNGSEASNGDSGGTAPGMGTAGAREVAAKLGRDHFLIGLGNDLDNNHDRDGAYTLGVSLDVHYAYLVGLMGMGGWPDWNDNGTFVNLLTDSAKRHGTVPMFTLYSMAAWGEANVAVLTNDDYMKPYWDGAKLLYQRLADFGEPAIVHFEPDWWAYAQQQGDPASVAVHVKALAPDCKDQPDNLVGMGKCLVALARKYAPKTLVGFHASLWANNDPAKIAEFLVKVGASEADIIFVDMLDRDAGCFEAHTDPNCQRGDTTGWYWDETNQTSPNFTDHLADVETIAKTVKKPVMWWQLPLGVPSTKPGGTAGHYRDNRVDYLFKHVDEFVAVGGVGAVFGTGAANQTDINTDGDQFKNAVTKYYQSPTPL